MHLEILGFPIMDGAYQHRDKLAQFKTMQRKKNIHVASAYDNKASIWKETSYIALFFTAF